MQCHPAIEEEEPLCDALLEDNEVERSEWWLYLIVLLGLFLIFRVAALYVLIVKARETLY